MGLLNDNHILLFIARSLQGFISVFFIVKFRQIVNFSLTKYKKVVKPLFLANFLSKVIKRLVYFCALSDYHFFFYTCTCMYSLKKFISCRKNYC